MSKNELLLYGEIGRDVTAATVAAALQAAGRARVQVRVHSAGGSLFEGLAIHSRLASHPGGVDITVDGLACSAASLVVMAGKHVAMSQSAWLMLHDPSASLAVVLTIFATWPTCWTGRARRASISMPAKPAWTARNLQR